VILSKKIVKKGSKGVERNFLFLYEVSTINTVNNKEVILDNH